MPTTTNFTLIVMRGKNESFLLWKRYTKEKFFSFMRLIRKHGSNPKFYFLKISLEFLDLFLLRKKGFQVILFIEIKRTKVHQKCQKKSILAIFLKTCSLRSNSVTRQVNFNWTKNWKIQMRHLEWTKDH